MTKRPRRLAGAVKSPSQAADFDDASLNDASLYMNRELSLLEFQRRVLEEARDPHNKLLERVEIYFHRQFERRRVLYGARGRIEAEAGRGQK